MATYRNGIVTMDFGSTDWGSNLAIQKDGKILMVGAAYSSQYLYRFALVRYNKDGSLDTNFSDDGKIITEILVSGSSSSVIIGTDSKILVGGFTYHDGNGQNFFSLARYNTNGSLDIRVVV